MSSQDHGLAVYPVALAFALFGLVLTGALKAQELAAPTPLCSVADPYTAPRCTPRAP